MNLKTDIKMDIKMDTKICLISKEPIINEICLPCNHSYEYEYLYEEIKQQKIDIKIILNVHIVDIYIILVFHIMK